MVIRNFKEYGDERHNRQKNMMMACLLKASRNIYPCGQWVSVNSNWDNPISSIGCRNNIHCIYITVQGKILGLCYRHRGMADVMESPEWKNLYLKMSIHEFLNPGVEKGIPCDWKDSTPHRCPHRAVIYSEDKSDTCQALCPAHFMVRGSFPLKRWLSRDEYLVSSVLNS